ncbi:MAG: hypothetical protein NC548_31985 [Lachnospiraceae bacterium]|nr:hypothetical protein [Lachnospiraceae bacterium]
MMKLKQLHDLDKWTIPKAMAYTETVIQDTKDVIIGILDELNYYDRSPFYKDGEALYVDIMAISKMLPIFGYDAENGRLVECEYPKKIITRDLISEEELVDVSSGVAYDESTADAIINDAYEGFQDFQMQQITREPFGLSDALYILHRENIELMIWIAFLNRFKRQGVLTFHEQQLDPGTISMLALTASTIQTIVAQRFPIRHYKDIIIPASHNLCMIIHQSVTFDQATPDTCFSLSILNGEPIIATETKLPMLDIRGISYVSMPKPTLR